MAKEQDWIEELNLDEVPEAYREIAQIIGLKNTIKLAEKYQGTALYLPKLDDALRKVRDRKILKEFNGYNYKLLARKYKLTEVWIRKIVSENQTDAGQMSIFKSSL